MANSVAQYLKEHGPTRSATVAAALQAQGLSATAARQQISRSREPVLRFPIPLLPKREAFLYLKADRNTERFWDNFLRDMRETGSIYGLALDGLIARGGIVSPQAFGVISGAPASPQKGQVAADLVISRLGSAGFVKYGDYVDFGPCVRLGGNYGGPDLKAARAYQIAESVVLDGLREWARKIGLASYNSIAIRGDATLKNIGPFAFDLAGPSYLLPLRAAADKPGFIVADVFSGIRMSAGQVQYFIRKARMLKAALPQAGVLSFLVADSFTGAALKAGHAGGVVLATPKDLFGQRAGLAIATLVETLKNAAAYASSETPDRIVGLLNSLAEIEGRAGNLRGILFELLAAYLARRDAMSIDMGIRAFDPTTGKTVDIDVQKVTAQASAVTAIECKGKGPGGIVQVDEVEEWLAKIPIIRAHYRQHSYFREAQISFELWTTGEFHPDALALLEDEKVKRTKAPIAWKDGQGVLDLAKAGKEKAIVDALNQHFLKHPLADVPSASPLEVAGPALGYPKYASPMMLPSSLATPKMPT